MLADRFHDESGRGSVGVGRVVVRRRRRVTAAHRLPEGLEFGRWQTVQSRLQHSTRVENLGGPFEFRFRRHPSLSFRGRARPGSSRLVDALSSASCRAPKPRRRPAACIGFFLAWRASLFEVRRSSPMRYHVDHERSMLCGAAKRALDAVSGTTTVRERDRLSCPVRSKQTDFHRSSRADAAAETFRTWGHREDDDSP